MAEQDSVIFWLESAKACLEVELQQHPLSQMIKDLNRLISARKTLMMTETEDAHAARWETDGGAVR